MINGTYNGHPVHLIESVSEFEFIKSLLDPKITVGMDTETQGLDYTQHRVVGVCISAGHSFLKEHYHGFYLPIRHSSYASNLPVSEVINFVQYIVDNYKTAWWNRGYDFSMLEFDGFKAPYVGHTHDVQCMAHLVLGESFPSLKDFAARYLKYQVIEFSSNKADQGNFGTTDPAVTFIYGSQDPLVTALLARCLWSQFPYIQKIYPLDNKFGEALRIFCRDTELYLDKELLQKQLDDVLKEQTKVKAEIFAMTGYEFRLTSNRDKADALSRVASLTQKTAKGEWAINKDSLSKIDHPLARLFEKYSNLEKFRGTYLEKMFAFPNPFRVNYQACNVSSGRISSGSSKGNSFFQPINIQNIPKQEVYRYLHKGSILGYYVDDDPNGAIFKIKTKGGMRDCFVPPKGFVWMAADYNAEEMRIMANLSNEHGLIEPILSGQDIHKFVATKMFGHYDPSHRTIAKIINFASNYGAGGYTIGKRLGVSEEEGEEMLARYNAALPALTRWKQEIMKDARRKGFVFTMLGRPRAVFMYYNTGNPKDKAFGDRTAVNSPVQGLGGDVIRMDFVKLLNALQSDPDFNENVKFALSVHDEIDVFVKPHYIKKCYQYLKSIMTFAPKQFQVPLIVEPSVGLDWGHQIDITESNIKDDGTLTFPEFEEQPLEYYQKKFREENPELFE